MRTNELEQMTARLKEGLSDEMLFNFMRETYHDNCTNRTFWQNPTREGWEKERAWIKETLHEMFSPFPEATPLNLRLTASYARDTYRMDCLCYDTAPDVMVTANLYVPYTATKGNTPAVVLACGHSDDSKSYYRFVAEAIVKAGMIALCFDPCDQGERKESWNYMRWQGRMHLAHDRLGTVATLLGGNLAGVFAWDCMRAVDCILACPETDPERIGFMGTSGGGMQTTWVAALDDRIAVVVPSCFITSIDHLLTSREPSDLEQNPPGLLGNGMEYRDFLGMMCPKPVLVLGTEKDFFPIEGARDTVASLKKLYACYDAEEKVDLFCSPGGHAGRGAMSTAGVAWMCRWFGLPVPAFAPEDGSKLENMFHELPSVNEDTYAAGGQQMFEATPKSYWHYYHQVTRQQEVMPVEQEALRRILAIKPVDMPVNITRKWEGRISGGWLNCEPGITLPWIYARASDAGSARKLCVLSHEDGMVCLFGNGREAELLLDAGVDVLAFDPRGLGVTRGPGHGWWAYCARRFLAPMKEEGALPYHVLGYVDPTYEGVYATGHELGTHGIKLNRPVLGQRTMDTLRVLHCLEDITDVQGYEVSVYGSAYSAIWMLYAALLTERKLDTCTLLGPLASFKQLAECPENRYSVEHIARGLLPVADIPQALTALKCPALVIDPTDAMRFPMAKILAEDILKDVPVQRFYTESMTNPLYHAVSFIRQDKM